MSDLLAWLTFGAALVAAVGTFVGPIIAYRASIRAIESDRELQAEGLRQQIELQQQQKVDELIVQATGDNPRLSSYAVAQLEYLLAQGALTVEQTTAARNAIDALTARMKGRLEEAVRVEEDLSVEGRQR